VQEAALSRNWLLVGELAQKLAQQEWRYRCIARSSLHADRALHRPPPCEAQSGSLAIQMVPGRLD